MKICVLIPIFNESQYIGALIKSLHSKELEVIVVDDGSTDNSREICIQNNVFVIRHDKRNGKGFSLRKGFDYCLKNNYDAIITMDGDGQHDVGDIDAFIKEAAKRKNVIMVGNRMNKPKNMPFIRLITNWLMSSLISLICGQRIYDTQCGFHLITKDYLEKTCLSSTGFEIETEILVEASRKGFEIVSVPIKTIYLDEESNIRPIKDTVKFFMYLLKIAFSVSFKKNNKLES